MDNIIQTFNKFNGGQKRPDRKGHLINCGFHYRGSYIIEDGLRPRGKAERLARQFNEVSGKPCHVVYLLGERNLDGCRGYQFWVKEV